MPFSFVSKVLSKISAKSSKFVQLNSNFSKSSIFNFFKILFVELTFKKHSFKTIKSSSFIVPFEIFDVSLKISPVVEINSANFSHSFLFSINV